MNVELFQVLAQEMDGRQMIIIARDLIRELLYADPRAGVADEHEILLGLLGYPIAHILDEQLLRPYGEIIFAAYRLGQISKE